MNKSIKTLAFAAIASIVLLACNDTSNASIGEDNNSQQKQVTPYDPPLVSIANDVGKWMEDNLASKSGEKKIIRISDMYMPDFESEAELSATIDSDGKVEYFLNGKKISTEEYQRKWEYERQKANFDKRNLSIPGEIIYENSRGWTVSVTAEELAEFVKNNDKLAIEFYIEPIDE